MAVLFGNNLTIADYQKRLNGKGEVATPVNLLSQMGELVESYVWKESDKDDSHTESVVTGLPEVYYSMINQGVPSSKSSHAQITEGMSMLEARSNVHVNLLRNKANRARIRMDEAMLFLEAMAQRDERTFWYGNPKSDPKEHAGMSVRYSSLAEANAQNIISAGGTTDLTSLWLLGWGEQSLFCPFPKGSDSVGLVRRDLGEQMIQDPNGTAGTYMQVLAEYFTWFHGVCLKDWRCCVRIPNIDTAALIAGTGTQATTAATNLLRLMSRAVDKVPKKAKATCKFSWWSNRTIQSGIKLLAMEKQTSVLSVQEGVDSFALNAFGIPFKVSDQLLNTEQAVA